MTSTATAATPWGVDACLVHVEVDCGLGLPSTVLVGLPDAAVRESRERVRSAIRNAGFDLRPRSTVINLAPADLRKEGNHLDLAIALTLLHEHGLIPCGCLDGRLICGELGLDGEVRGVRGALAFAELATIHGFSELIVPRENAPEAAALEAVKVIGVGSLLDAIAHLVGPGLEATPPPADPIPRSGQPDLGEVRGQEGARRALEIAAAGGHNLLLVGPPGGGKTMLARRLPGILPPLSRSESIAVTRIHSIGGLPLDGPLVSERPFRAPHHTISTAGLVGGGPVPRPGEVSLAHGGVLFLDELPEFRRDTLEVLRQPLEAGMVSIVRARARYDFPARFALFAAMNPCPCGHLGDPRHDCRCPEPLVERYRGRISGPLLDRIDLHVEIPGTALRELRGPRGETSDRVAARVAEAREIQARRFVGGTINPTNAQLDGESLRRHAVLDPAGEKLLETAFERLGLSGRAWVRVLRVARTIADLAHSEAIRAAHVAEAIQYRSFDRRTASVAGPQEMS
jgi:magnesium chelatase family protein